MRVEEGDRREEERRKVNKRGGDVGKGYTYKEDGKERRILDRKGKRKRQQETEECIVRKSIGDRREERGTTGEEGEETGGRRRQARQTQSVSVCWTCGR